MAYKVNEKHTLDEYNQKYANKNLKEYAKAEVEKDPSLLEDKDWWLIDGTYYEVEKSKCPIIVWWLGLQKAVQIGIIAAAGVVAVGGITAGIIAGASKGNDNNSENADPRKDENVPTVALTYYEPTTGAFQYHFENKLDKFKVTETEWTFNVVITAGDPEWTSDWYVLIGDSAYTTEVARSEVKAGAVELGSYSVKATLCSGINLNDFVGQSLVVGLGSYTC